MAENRDLDPCLVWSAVINARPAVYHSMMFTNELDEHIWGEKGMNIGRTEPVYEKKSIDIETPGLREVKLYPSLGMFQGIVRVIGSALVIPEDIHYISKQKKFPVWIRGDKRTHRIMYENKFPLFPSVTLTGYVDILPHQTDSKKCIHSMTCKFETGDSLFLKFVKWPVEQAIGAEISRYVQSLSDVIDSFIA